VAGLYAGRLAAERACQWLNEALDGGYNAGRI